MNSKRWILILLALVIALTVYAAALQWQPVMLVDGYAPYRFGIVRYEDLEADVICWTYNGYFFGSISCLPRSETEY